MGWLFLHAAEAVAGMGKLNSESSSAVHCLIFAAVTPEKYIISVFILFFNNIQQDCYKMTALN